MNRRRLVSAAVVALLVVGSVAPSAMRADAQENPPSLVGRAQGLATGLGIEFSRVGTLPFDPVVDLVFGHAEGTYDEASGTITAVAAAAYPGKTVAEPAVLLPLIGFPVGGALFAPDHPVSEFYGGLGDLLPTWPTSVTASYPVNPSGRREPIGDLFGVVPQVLPIAATGLDQTAVADANIVQADTTAASISLGNPVGQLPQLAPVVDLVNGLVNGAAGLLGDGGTQDYDVGGAAIGISGLDTSYETVKGAETVRSRAETLISEISMLGGILKFGRVRMAAAHESDGNETRLLEHTAEIGSVTVFGLQAAIDEQGLRITDSRIPVGLTGAVLDGLGQVLKAAGVDLTIIAPSATSEGPVARSNGLMIEIIVSEPPVEGVSLLGSVDRITLQMGQVVDGLEGSLVTARAGLAGPGVGVDVSAGGTQGAGSASDSSSAGSTASAFTPTGPAESGGATTGPTGSPSAPTENRSAVDTRAAGAAFSPALLAAVELRDLYRRIAVLSTLGFVIGTGMWRRRWGMRLIRA